MCVFRWWCKWCQHDPSSWYWHWNIWAGGHAGVSRGLCIENVLLLFVLSEIYHYSSLSPAGGHGQRFCHISLQTPQKASAGSRTLVPHTTRQHDHLLLLQECGESCRFVRGSSVFLNVLSEFYRLTRCILTCSSGLCEPAVLVSVPLRLLGHRHDWLLADDFLQPLLHLRPTHHVWDNGQRRFCRDAAGRSWTVPDRAGCRGEWHAQTLPDAYSCYLTHCTEVCVILGIHEINFLVFHARCLLPESCVLLYSIPGKRRI